jgi:hypothetical protein
MTKIGKVKIIKSKVKMVREIDGEGNDETIQEVTAGEVVTFDDVMPVFGGTPGETQNVVQSSGPVILDSSPQESLVREDERIAESRLYEARGAALAEVDRGTESSGRVYATSESVQMERIKEARIGRDFAMESRGSLFAEGQAMQTQDKLREESDSEKKYADGLSGGSKKEARKMPWEV